MKKTLLSFILSICLFSMSLSFTSNANDTNDLSKTQNIVGTYEYFSHFYKESDNVQITDKNGNDVTTYFIENTKYYFDSSDIDSIKYFMADEELVAHLYEEEIPLIKPFAAEQYKNVYDNITAYYTDNKYGTVMEFACKLTGGIWYNPNTYAVTRTSKPTFSVTYMGVPAGISPSCNSITTGSNVSNGKGYFWARFTVTGEGYIDPGISLLLYNYGTHTVSFYGTP